ncbi:uncharacterized protein LOC107426488 isoform X2 [Ziziphus jujuba]|uniref:Uncharacterized protein LOC107426488 isoform X2 n=1 Tax=Ziziphus jujuba TaxID=326968 RepID=A0ABM3IXI8_ZIZJJ|nr:uncharacterized protein LOC107426488 isoform X2 [Ziziphus jujuba]
MEETPEPATANERVAGVHRLQQLLDVYGKGSSEVAALVDCCKDLLKDNDLKRLSESGRQAVASAAVLYCKHLQLNFFNALVPAYAEFLGNAKRDVRDAARGLLLTLMELHERVAGLAIARTVTSTLCFLTYTKQPLQWAILPPILKMLNDSNPGITEAAILCIEELYRQKVPQFLDELRCYLPSSVVEEVNARIEKSGAESSSTETSSLEEVLQLASAKGTEEWMAGVERLQQLLESYSGSLGSSKEMALVDCCKDLLEDSNLIVPQGAFQAVASAAVLSYKHLKLNFNALVPAYVECLGNAKWAVRHAAQRLLLTLMELPEHDDGLEIARKVTSIICFLAYADLPLHGTILPPILKMLNDSNPGVTEAAMLCIEEIYTQAGPQFLDELHRYYLPSSVVEEIKARLENIAERSSTKISPTGALPMEIHGKFIVNLPIEKSPSIRLDALLFYSEVFGAIPRKIISNGSVEIEICGITVFINRSNVANSGHIRINCSNLDELLARAQNAGATVQRKEVKLCDCCDSVLGKVKDPFNCNWIFTTSIPHMQPVQRFHPMQLVANVQQRMQFRSSELVLLGLMLMFNKYTYRAFMPKAD